VIITHDQGIADRMPRRIEMLDGRIAGETPCPCPPATGSGSGGPAPRPHPQAHLTSTGAAMTTTVLAPRPLAPADLLRLSSVGLRTRKLRASSGA